MTHTPGPWKHQVWHGIHQTVIDANGKTVAFDISTRDNAQLIAAAPEMLTVLQNLKCANGYFDAGANAEAKIWLDRAAKLAKEVLEKIAQ